MTQLIVHYLKTYGSISSGTYLALSVHPGILLITAVGLTGPIKFSGCFLLLASSPDFTKFHARGAVFFPLPFST